jgi:uncharacterized protein involved in exopolysaccharide biosynthesis
MKSVRRRILRSPPVAGSQPGPNRQRQLARLEKERATLDRWMAKLTRACSAIKKQQHCIARLERRLASGDHS